MSDYVSRAEVEAAEPPIAGHAIWPELRQWIESQTGSQNQSRFPLRADTPPPLLRRALAVEVRCTNCSGMHYPVRLSGKNAAMFVTGRRDAGHKSCSYGVAARAAVKWLREDLGRPDAAAPREQPVKQSKSEKEEGQVTLW